jgi:hypothetical protein
MVGTIAVLARVAVHSQLRLSWPEITSSPVSGAGARLKAAGRTARPGFGRALHSGKVAPAGHEGGVRDARESKVTCALARWHSKR